MGNSESRPTFTRQQARDLVRTVLCTADLDQRIVEGTVRLAPLRWMNQDEACSRYRQALSDMQRSAINQAGMISEDVDLGHDLADKIHRVWRDLARVESEDTISAAIRQRLVEQGVIKLRIPRDVTPVIEQPKEPPKEIIRNPFPLRGGRGPQW